MNEIERQMYEECVSSPGKFQDEHIATPYYHSRALDGDGDWSAYCESGVMVEVTEDEREEFGFEDDVTIFALLTTNDGFVIGQSFASDEAAEDWFRDFEDPDY